MWGRKLEMTELLSEASFLLGRPTRKPTFSILEIALHQTNVLALLSSILGGGMSGNNKINVEYFGWSGMKQEVPKVCPCASL